MRFADRIAGVANFYAKKDPEKWDGMNRAERRAEARSTRYRGARRHHQQRHMLAIRRRIEKAVRTPVFDLTKGN